jgi:hypothetical protein
LAKVLFILKRRADFSTEMQTKEGLSTGLYNSASFMRDMLQQKSITSKMVVVQDYNEIDREVSAWWPTHVIIEALWVIPAKFAELQKLHPRVTWIIRLHSDMPFIAGEGMAMDWLGDYSSFDNVVIAANSPRMLREMRNYYQWCGSMDRITAAKKVVYLPNSYPRKYRWKWPNRFKPTIDICCFGAIRPMKNHLIQAMAAIEFANRIGKQLRFHINVGRVEGRGEPVLRNLTALFEQLNHTGHELIMHEWTPRDQFLDLCHSMDIGMQVSFSETFNIVAADLVSQGVPVVCSTEIPWGVHVFAADTTLSASMVDKLLLTWELPVINAWWHRRKLRSYCRRSQQIWAKYFHTEQPR